MIKGNLAFRNIMKEKRCKNIENKAHKTSAKSALKVSAALVLTAAVALGSLFSEPEDITGEQFESILNPTPVVLDIDSLPENKLDESTPEESKKRGIRERLRAAILNLPPWVRSLIIAPLQLLGTLIIWLAGLLATQLAGSAAGILASTLIALAVAAALLILAAKLLFPNMPLNEIFNRKNIAILMIAGAVAGTADFIATQYIEGYLVVSIFVKMTFCLLFVNISIFQIRRRRAELGV